MPVRPEFGPIQAMIFVVPSISGQTAITAEAARAVFGAGGDNGMAVPWTNPDLYFVRNVNTGTQQMIGHAIGVPISDTTADRYSAGALGRLVEHAGASHPFVMEGDDTPKGAKITRAPDIAPLMQGDGGFTWNGVEGDAR